MKLAHLGVSPANKGIPMTEEQKRKNSLAHIGQISWNKDKHGHLSQSTLQKLRESHIGQIAWNRGITGENSHSWKGGKSFEPYTAEFNEQLKELTRMRDNYTCQLCGVPQAECVYPLAPHHIDYNKTNCLPSNLIALCLKCNSRVNYNRDIWQVYFNNVIEQKEILGNANPVRS